MTLTSLALALLAAAGAQRLVDAAASRRASRRGRSLGRVRCSSLAVLIEGSGFDLGRRAACRGPSHPPVPTPPAGQRGAPAPQLHLPITVAGNRRYVLWSTRRLPARSSTAAAASCRALRRARDATCAASPTRGRWRACARSACARSCCIRPRAAARLAGRRRAAVGGLGVARERAAADVVLYALERRAEASRRAAAERPRARGRELGRGSRGRRRSARATAPSVTSRRARRPRASPSQSRGRSLGASSSAATRDAASRPRPRAPRPPAALARDREARASPTTASADRGGDARPATAASAGQLLSGAEHRHDRVLEARRSPITCAQ